LEKLLPDRKLATSSIQKAPAWRTNPLVGSVVRKR
jgi:hypothetical protein